MWKYQSWFRVNQRWKSNVSELRKSALNSADSELFLSAIPLVSSETALKFSVLNSADSEKIRADQLWNRADQRWYFSCSLNQRWKTSKLWNSAVQRWLPLGLQPRLVFLVRLRKPIVANHLLKFGLINFNVELKRELQTSMKIVHDRKSTQTVYSW